MTCLPPKKGTHDEQEPDTCLVHLMERALTAVDPGLRSVVLLLKSADLPGPPPALLLSEKDAALLILSLQKALHHCRQLPFPDSTPPV